MQYPSFVKLNPAFDEIVDTDASIRLIAGGFQFTEGPAWNYTDQFLLFSDIPANSVYRWAEGDGHCIWRHPSQYTNGNTFDRNGRLLSCEHGSRMLTQMLPNSQVTALATHYQNKQLNSPNDVVVKSDGTIWFTDPPYGIAPEQKEQAANHVFRLVPGECEPVAVISDIAMPNGLCFSPDETLLYIADSDLQNHHVRRFRVHPDNTLEGGEVFVTVDNGVPDGMRADAKGRLLCTAGDGVRIHSPDGVHLGTIATPEVAANCTFGGRNGNTLFITATSMVWAVDLAISGIQPQG